MIDETIEQVKNFYEQYLYLKDIYYVFMDANSAEECSESGKPFFKMATSACIDSYMLTLARLFDEDGKSFKISDFINYCKKNKDDFTNPSGVFLFLKEHGKKLTKDQTLKHAIEVINHRRNKYLAHNDREYFSHSKETDKSIIDDEHLPSYEIWALINWLTELFEVIIKELPVDLKDMKPKYNRELVELIPEIGNRQINPI